MGATTYFPTFKADENFSEVQGSSFGEPDGTTHRIEVLEGDGHLIIRVEVGDAKPVDLLFREDQAKQICEGVEGVLRRLSIR